MNLRKIFWEIGEEIKDFWAGWWWWYCTVLCGSFRGRSVPHLLSMEAYVTDQPLLCMALPRSFGLQKLQQASGNTCVLERVGYSAYDPQAITRERLDAIRSGLCPQKLRETQRT